MTKTIKAEDFGPYSVGLEVDKNGVYETRLSQIIEGTGIYRNIKRSTTGNKKNALATYYRYRKEARENTK